MSALEFPPGSRHTDTSPSTTFPRGQAGRDQAPPQRSLSRQHGGWDTDLDATISAARDGWPTPPELTSQIERMLPHAAGYWHAADNLIGLLKVMQLAEQARTGLPWVHQIITSRGKVPGMATWLAVGWLRSLSEGQAVNDETRPPV